VSAMASCGEGAENTGKAVKGTVMVEARRGSKQTSRLFQ